MAIAHTFRIALAALLFAGATLPAGALQLGETKAQVQARHGEPGAEDRGKGVAIYFWTGWSAELEFKEEAVGKLVYRRESYLPASEVASLLQSNGGAARWRETTSAGEETRRWVRDDGAVAHCLAVRPMMMTFESGKGRPPALAVPAIVVVPKNVVPAPSPVVSSTPPSFPKLLGSEPAPTPTPTTSSTAVTLSPLRPLPKLPAEEVAAEPPPPQSPAPAEAPAVARDASSSEAETLPANEPAAGNLGPLWRWLAMLVAALGGGIYLLKAKSGRGAVEEMTPRPTASRAETRAPAPGCIPALDALRNDQFELLVGEIFRREGYAVELSAAAAQDDNIDLTLRRDSETILVQCKHWKVARVTEREVREFHGAMMANGAPRGIFVTAGNFTREAQEFAAGKQIDLMDRTALEESTTAVTRPGENFCGIQEWVGEFTTHARVFDPECPICQGTMVIRHHRANGAASWGCRNHPRCPGRREARLDLLSAA